MSKEALVKIAIKKVENTNAVLKYLINGGEIKYGERTYVWVHDIVVDQVGDQQIRVDGLAVKKMKKKRDEKVSKIYYHGVHINLDDLFMIVDNISPARMAQIRKAVK